MTTEGQIQFLGEGRKPTPEFGGSRAEMCVVQLRTKSIPLCLSSPIDGAGLVLCRK